MEVNGTRLYVDDRGDADAPALLMMHGGPGNPCWDFMESVGDLLAERVRVIGVDQRGVLRSDPLPAEPPLTVDLLVADFEALRQQLGIERWAILGHSAGGAYALDYALAHTAAVTAAIFDCPCWDADRTDRHRLPRVAAMLDAAGQAEAADECRWLATKPDRLTAQDEPHVAMLALGEDYLDIFFPTPAARAAYDALVATAPDDFDWERGGSHRTLLTEMYDDRVPRLADLTVPTLLVRGSEDMVAPPDVVADYERAGIGAVHTFDGAGHFPFIERPDEYAAVVGDFVLETLR